MIIFFVKNQGKILLVNGFISDVCFGKISLIYGHNFINIITSMLCLKQFTTNLEYKLKTGLSF